MDRENLLVPGWSHVLSTTNDLAELDALRKEVGAPRQALHLGRKWPHLDLKHESRDRALAHPGVRVFESTPEMLRFIKSLREGANTASGGPRSNRPSNRRAPQQDRD